jgi:tetratricopeptide (TPR) repeat protein
LYARCLLFEGIALQYGQYEINETLGRRCLTLFNQSIVLEPQSPIPWIKMSISYAQNLGVADSALMCARHAANLLPNQPLPYTELAYSFINMGNQWELVRQLVQEAEAIDSHNLFVAAAWGEWYLRAPGGDLEKALAYFEKCQQQGGLNFSWWHANYAILLREQGRFVDSELEFKKSIEIDSTLAWVWSNLGALYNMTRRYTEAEPVLKKAIALDSTYANPRKHLGMVCFKTNRPDEARQHFLKAITLNPDYAGAMLGMAYLFASEGKTEEALGYVEQAIGKGITFEQLQSDEDFAPLRALPEWKALMKKHFPDKVKD